MPTCPNGHQSGSDDWCEVCGHRMAAPGAPEGTAPPPPPPSSGYGYGYPGPGDPNATAHAELCPQCRTPREAMAPFCEECRYNFLTHTATSYTPLAPAPQPPVPNLPAGFTNQPSQQQPAPPRVPGPQDPGLQGGSPHPGPGQGPDAYDYRGSRPSQLNRPAEPLREGQGHQPPAPPFQQGPPPPPPFTGGQDPRGPGQPGPPSYQQQAAPPAAPQQTVGTDDWTLPPPSQPQSPAAPPGPGQQGGPPSYQQQAPPQYGRPDQGQGLAQGHGQAPGPGQHQSPPSYQHPGGWTAVIGPDREYFMAMMQRSGPDASGLNLPAYSPEQRLPLVGNQITIGRRRVSTGESPDIDLSVPPEDPGVSHQHAVLVQQSDGSWAVVDQNSTNGTTLNGAEDPIQPYVPVPLNDGDRVHVGAWTTITIRRG
ncbi:FHA domain-containing protein [Streptomyces sp. NPDC051018]|uniref:FHA domain-containing protein n=1 Tax=Streptomyces sp. NPDC051018 TaxID=3365639 RepID=UPI00378A28A5